MVRLKRELLASSLEVGRLREEVARLTNEIGEIRATLETCARKPSPDAGPTYEPVGLKKLMDRQKRR